MNKIPVFQGSCTAIVTPFCDRGIDYARLERNLAPREKTPRSPRTSTTSWYATPSTPAGAK